MSLSFFEDMAPGRTRALLNVLVEAPFFFQSDDPELYAYLRRHHAEVARFFEEAYGWQLVVEPKLARLHKPRWHNGALKRSQRSPLELTKKDDCIAFLLVLELYEHLLEARSASIDDAEPLRFEIGELFTHAQRRLDEQVGPGRYDAGDVRAMFRGLMPALVRHRFIRELPREEGASDAAAERAIYEALPSLAMYDVTALGEEAVSRALTSTVSGGDDASTEPCT